MGYNKKLNLGEFDLAANVWTTKMLVYLKEFAETRPEVARLLLLKDRREIWR